MNMIIIVPNSAASSILCGFPSLAREILRLDSPYINPVIAKGMSKVRFIIKAFFSAMLFAMKRLDPIWRIPITMKNKIETFLIFLKVSIGWDYTGGG